MMASTLITRTQWTLIAGIILLETLVTTWVVVRLPKAVPMHWNLAGEVDRYGSPWELAWLGPPMTLLVAGLVVGLPRVPSIRTALLRSGSMYGRIAVALVGGIAAIHLAVVFPVARAALPERDGPHGMVTADQIVSPMLVISGLFFAVLGNWMSKVRRNPVFGVRTPATMESDAVWERTQRWSGRLFALLGLIGAVTAIFCPLWVSGGVLGIGTLLWCFGAHVYSWRLARSMHPADSGKGQVAGLVAHGAATGALILVLCYLLSIIASVEAATSAKPAPTIAKEMALVPTAFPTAEPVIRRAVASVASVATSR